MEKLSLGNRYCLFKAGLQKYNLYFIIIISKQFKVNLFLNFFFVFQKLVEILGCSYKIIVTFSLASLYW